VAGRCLLGPAELRAAGIEAAYALTDLEDDVGRCIEQAGPLLERLAGRIARDRLDTSAAGVPARAGERS